MHSYAYACRNRSCTSVPMRFLYPPFPSIGTDLIKLSLVNEATSMESRTDHISTNFNNNRGGGLSYKKDGGCLSYLLGVKKAVLVALGVLSLKRYTMEAFAVPFRVLNKNKFDCLEILCFFKIGTS